MGRTARSDPTDPGQHRLRRLLRPADDSTRRRRRIPYGRISSIPRQSADPGGGRPRDLPRSPRTYSPATRDSRVIPLMTCQVVELAILSRSLRLTSWSEPSGHMPSCMCGLSVPVGVAGEHAIESASRFPDSWTRRFERRSRSAPMAARLWLGIKVAGVRFSADLHPLRTRDPCEKRLRTGHVGRPEIGRPADLHRFRIGLVYGTGMAWSCLPGVDARLRER